MPSTMPNQSQAKNLSPRKHYKPKRKLTTLSFERLERAGTNIFTEDISSSSRIPRPSYVLRQGDVVGANMPDTVRLSKHRSKIYVGLSDTSSLASSRMESRRVARSEATSSAATTIGKASIIDWTDAGSEVNANVPFSGELSFILPPVQVARSVTSKRTPPGLDTSDIFSYRAVHHKHHGSSKSPRPPPSRAGGKPIAGFRPPQNTPFNKHSSSREFVASIRKKVMTRTSFEGCNVVVCGGSMSPITGVSRESRRKTFYSRESTSLSNADKKGKRKDMNSNNNPGIGMPSFDLPVIDLKCVESPIADLGDLEEKGIRLVKLKNTKKRPHISHSSSDPDRPGSVNGDSVVADDNAEIKTGRLEADKELYKKDIEKSFVQLSLHGTSRHSTNGDQGATTVRSEVIRTSKNRSVTTSSTGSENSTDGKEDDNFLTEDILINREPYSTPLLPDTSRTINTSRSPAKFETANLLGVSESAPDPNDVTGDKGANVEDSSDLNVVVVVQNTGPTPLNLSSGSSTPKSVLSPRGESYAGDTDEASTRRTRHRTSSLLSVPASIISECRPPSPPIRETPQELLENETIFEFNNGIEITVDDEGNDIVEIRVENGEAEGGINTVEVNVKRDENLEEGDTDEEYVRYKNMSGDRRKSKTVSTQTQVQAEGEVEEETN